MPPDVEDDREAAGKLLRIIAISAALWTGIVLGAFWALQ